MFQISPSDPKILLSNNRKTISLVFTSVFLITQYYLIQSHPNHNYDFWVSPGKGASISVVAPTLDSFFAMYISFAMDTTYNLMIASNCTSAHTTPSYFSNIIPSFTNFNSSITSACAYLSSVNYICYHFCNQFTSDFTIAISCACYGYYMSPVLYVISGGGQWLQQWQKAVVPRFFLNDIISDVRKVCIFEI